MKAKEKYRGTVGPKGSLKEENKLLLQRSKYLLEHIRTQDEQIGEDDLTGLKTRKFFEKELDRVLEDIRVRGKGKENRVGDDGEVAVLFIDLDKFKNVNDTLGHAEGDRVLKKVALLMKGALRGTDLVARYGGDEFIVLLPGTNEENAVTAANNVRSALNSSQELKKLEITASIGVSSINALEASKAIDSKTLVHTVVVRADVAAYIAKRAGGDRVKVRGDDI